MFKVTDPATGQSFIVPQTDRGPAKWTGRDIDVNRPLAEKFGYPDPKKFPTDQTWTVEPVTPQQAAPKTAPQAAPMSDTTGGWKPGDPINWPAASEIRKTPYFRPPRAVPGDPEKTWERLTKALQARPGLGRGEGEAGPQALKDKLIQEQWRQEHQLKSWPGQLEDIPRSQRGGTPGQFYDPRTGAPQGQPISYDKDVNLNLRVNDNDMQFARSSMRREADREVRETRWNSYSDIGAA